MRIKGAGRQDTERPRGAEPVRRRHVSMGDEEQALGGTFGGGEWLKIQGKTGG